jgi:acetoacetate decarboxylase
LAGSFGARKENLVKIDNTKIYMMLHIQGPLYEKESLPGIPYPKTETIAMQFQTEGEAARRLVPNSYDVDPAPVVTVMFGYHKGLDFLAGGGYSIATFQVAAKFDGAQDHVEGDYILVMFENDTRPILGGRELLGVPKLFADIPPVKIMPNGNLRCEASLWGHLLFGIELPPMKKQNPLVKTIASRRINNRPWLAYKYFPALDGPPDADYPTTTRNDVKIGSLLMGNAGSLYFGSATSDDISHIANVVDVLKSLPVVKIEQVLHLKGSAVLRLDQSRRLR